MSSLKMRLRSFGFVANGTPSGRGIKVPVFTKYQWKEVYGIAADFGGIHVSAKPTVYPTVLRLTTIGC
jgi:hypothetical protein